MKLTIRNMVCDRCNFAIQNVLDDLDLAAVAVRLGEVDFGDTGPDAERLAQFQIRIEALGFELINDKKSRLIESIKNNVIALLQQLDTPDKVKLSAYISHHLHHDYGYLSNLFSAVEGITIEHYFIAQKIEKTKELLVYDELTLTEIAHRLGYSSVAHLSRQFKAVTGLTPSQFKLARGSHLRRSIDKL